MKSIPWNRKPAWFYCPACQRWVDDSVVTGDQVHDRARGGCGEFVLSKRDVEKSRSRILAPGNDMSTKMEAVDG